MLDEQNVVILIEDTGSLSAHENAERLSKLTGFPVYELKQQSAKHKFKGSQWQLVYSQNGLCLRLSSEPSWGDIRVDFASAALEYRKRHGGGKNESLAKAIGIKGKDTLSVIDCTAGMGTDSFVMASVGAQVTMLERSPVVAALLDDALMRAENAQLDIADKLTLYNSDASEYLLNTENTVDVIYLDPMFPHKKKSAMVKKEMQAFQKLLGPDQDSEKLLELALQRANKRVVVKRPSYAEPIALASGRNPDTEIKSKKHRFDVYLCHLN